MYQGAEAEAEAPLMHWAYSKDGAMRQDKRREERVPITSNCVGVRRSPALAFKERGADKGLEPRSRVIQTVS